MTAGMGTGRGRQLGSLGRTVTTKLWQTDKHGCLSAWHTAFRGEGAAAHCLGSGLSGRAGVTRQLHGLRIPGGGIQRNFSVLPGRFTLGEPGRLSGVRLSHFLIAPNSNHGANPTQRLAIYLLIHSVSLDSGSRRLRRKLPIHRVGGIYTLSWQHKTGVSRGRWVGGAKLMG